MKKPLRRSRIRAKVIDLSQRYPISALIDIRKTAWTFTGAAIAGAAAVTITVVPPDHALSLHDYPFVQALVQVLAVLLSCLWFVRFTYEFLRRQCLYYGLEDGHFVISQGIILRQRGFFPLSRITDVYLERSLLDLIFGLHTLHISTPTPLSERFARIEGLDEYTARALQHYLTAALERSAMELDVRDPRGDERSRFITPASGVAISYVTRRHREFEELGQLAAQ